MIGRRKRQIMFWNKARISVELCAEQTQIASVAPRFVEIDRAVGVSDKSCAAFEQWQLPRAECDIFDEICF